LQRFMNQVAADIEDPETHVSVGARLRARLLVEGFSSAQARESAQAHEDDRKRAALAASGADLPLDALGSGSDYSAFLQHLGVTALDFAYEGEAENSGVYHSLYDSYDHYVRFGDPGFAYGVAMSETGGHLMLRMAQAEVLPLQFTGLAATVENYRQEVHRLAEERRKHAEDLGRLLDEHAFTLASDPKHPLLPPRRDAQGPYLEFAPLDNAVARLQVAARSYDEAYAKMAASGAPLAADNRNELNDLLRGMEQTLTDSRGLPGRPWYVHMLYAPGSLTGYGAKTVPGIREAIEQDRWAEANEYIGITARALDAYTDRLERATALLPK
jgi:N-acetylated-alpha-linked acidic dipeptidase